MNEFFGMLGLEIDWIRSSIIGGLILLRILTVIGLIPFLFGNPVPNMIRMTASLVLLAFVYPAVAPTVPANILGDPLFVIALFAKEFFYGLAIGLAGSMIFYGFEALGAIIDNQRGASMAQIFSPQTGTQVTIFAQFSLQLGIVIFLCLGGHILFFDAFFKSYELLPIYEFPGGAFRYLDLMDHFIKISGAVLMIAAELAAPVLISIFVVDIVLGVMNRISPAVNVLDMGFAIRGVVGVIIFAVAITVVADQMKIISMETINNVKLTIRYLAGAA